MTQIDKQLKVKIKIHIKKELSLCHKLKFFNPNIFAAQRRRPQIFQTLNSVRSNNVSLKYQRPTPSGCKDIGIRIFEFVAKTQFLYTKWYLIVL